MTHTYLLFFIASLAVTPHLTSSLLFSLSLSCSWEVLQNLGFDHLPILLTVPLSPVFCPNKSLPFLKFLEAWWDDFGFYFDCHCLSAEEYSSFFLSFAATLFSFLVLNAAKSSIPSGCIKRHLKAWWSAEVEEVVSERCKDFAAAHRSDEDRQVTSLLTDVPRLSLPRLRHGRRLALLFHPNITLNLYTLFFALLLPLPPLLTSLTVLLPGNRLRSLVIT